MILTGVLAVVALAFVTTRSTQTTDHDANPFQSRHRGTEATATRLLSAIKTKTVVSSSTARARDLVRFLVEEQQCFSTVEGALAFGQVCAVNVVYEDRFEPHPIVGKTVG
jgi:hypothetical protein